MSAHLQTQSRKTWKLENLKSLLKHIHLSLCIAFTWTNEQPIQTSAIYGVRAQNDTWAHLCAEWDERTFWKRQFDYGKRFTKLFSIGDNGKINVRSFIRLLVLHIHIVDFGYVCEKLFLLHFFRRLFDFFCTFFYHQNSIFSNLSMLLCVDTPRSFILFVCHIELCVCVYAVALLGWPIWRIHRLKIQISWVRADDRQMSFRCRCFSFHFFSFRFHFTSPLTTLDCRLPANLRFGSHSQFFLFVSSSSSPFDQCRC